MSGLKKFKIVEWMTDSDGGKKRRGAPIFGTNIHHKSRQKKGKKTVVCTISICEIQVKVRSVREHEKCHLIIECMNT